MKLEILEDFAWAFDHITPTAFDKGSIVDTENDPIVSVYDDVDVEDFETTVLHYSWAKEWKSKKKPEPKENKAMEGPTENKAAKKPKPKTKKK